MALRFALTALLLATAACGTTQTTIEPEPIAADGDLTAGSEAEGSEVEGSDAAEGTEVAAVEMVEPTRETVIPLRSETAADGTTSWVAAGPPIAPTGHYAGDTPEGVTPGTYDATFRGAVLGDYPHITFEVDMQEMDFGAGDNQFAGTPFAGKSPDDMGSLVGKEFALTWDYRASTFMCCDGSTDTFRGMKPSITAISELD